MSKKIKQSPETENTSDSESCELCLSADGNWMRLLVGGKQTATFHVSYVKKVLAAGSKTTKTEISKKPETSATV